MSYKAVTWAIEQKAPSLAKLVLIMLARRHNHLTGRCDPSIACLADDCGMSKDAVRGAIAKLAVAGMITVESRSDGTRQISNSYRFAFGGGSGLELLGGVADTDHRLSGVVAETDQGSSSERPGVVGETYQGVVAETDTKEGTLFNHGSRTMEEKVLIAQSSQANSTPSAETLTLLPVGDPRGKVIGNMPLVGKDADGGFDVFERDRDEWQGTFPGVNVNQQLRQAKQWLIDNPTQRKTRNGIRSFINRWLSREQNSFGGFNGNHAPNKSTRVRSGAMAGLAKLNAQSEAADLGGTGRIIEAR